MIEQLENSAKRASRFPHYWLSSHLSRGDLIKSQATDERIRDFSRPKGNETVGIIGVVACTVARGDQQPGNFEVSLVSNVGNKVAEVFRFHVQLESVNCNFPFFNSFSVVATLSKSEAAAR